MALEQLTPEERQIVHECLIAASVGPWRGQLVRMESSDPVADTVLESWPSFDESEERVRGVKALLMSLVSEPGDAWPLWISAVPEEVEAIVHKWGGPLRNLVDLPRPSGASLLSQAKRYLDMPAPHLAEPILESAAQDPVVRSECLVYLAEIDLGMTQYEEARTRCDEVLPVLRTGSDKPLLAKALLVRGWADDGEETSWFEEALPLLLDSDMPYEAAQCLEAMGADAELERAAELYNETNSRLGRPRVLRRRAVLAIERGDSTAAFEFCREALADLEGVLLRQARADECFCIELIGDAHRAAGNKDEAAAAYRSAHERLTGLEHGRGQAVKAKLEEL